MIDQGKINSRITGNNSAIWIKIYISYLPAAVGGGEVSLLFC
jgi:hypothetical protein